MSLATALVALKTADATLNTLISTRFSPDVTTQGQTLPFVVFQEVSRTRVKTWGVALPPLFHSTVLLKCYAATEVLRAALVTAVLDAFCSTTAVTAGGHSVKGIEFENEFSGGIELLGTSTEAYVGIVYLKVHIL